MSSTDNVQKVLNNVSTRKQAEAVVTELIMKFSGETAKERMEEFAKRSKQSVKEEVRRVVSRSLISYFK